VPITSQPRGWLLAAEEFAERFGMEKPPLHTKELIFYCKAGVRSGIAAAAAQQGGYARVSEYRGSWLDWEKRQRQKQNNNNNNNDNRPA
jgi:3-mercaptopyruvate sulfurtransferase SseA